MEKVELARYTKARIKKEVDMEFGGMKAGDEVYVSYWKHEWNVKPKVFEGLFFITKTPDLKTHIAEGTFATVFQRVLENFTD